MRPLTDFEQVLLGYVAREPQSGYRLRKRFSTSPAGVYQPSPGALYPALRRLVGRGLLSVDEQVSTGHRRLRVYRVTEAGRAAHLEWLHQPVDPATVARNISLHLMRFAMMEDLVEPAEVQDFLRSLAVAIEAFVAGIERYLASEAVAGRRHGLLALEHGIAVHRASAAWARSALAALESPDEPAEQALRCR